MPLSNEAEPVLKSDPRALNPVIGGIQTVGELAQLLVTIGQQVLPGLIAGVVANSPMPLSSRTLDHGMLLKSIIGGLSGADSMMKSGVSEDETNFTTSVEAS